MNKLQHYPLIFIDIIPMSLYKSLVEMKVRIQSKKEKEKVAFSFPSELKIVSVDARDEIGFETGIDENIVNLYLSKSFTQATFLLGKISENHGGSVCLDSGWELYPLMSNKLKINFSISPYDKLALRIIVPENCHCYCDKKYSFVRIDNSEKIKKYHFPEQMNHIKGDDNPFRLKSYFHGYPLTRFVPFLIDNNIKGKRVKIELHTYFREAFLFHIISVFTPILYGIPIIALWAYPSDGLDISKKIPIMIAIIPFYIGLWYKSNVMKSVPTVTNFLTFLYVFLYFLYIIYAILLTYFNGFKIFIGLTYVLIIIAILITLTVFCVRPVQESKFLQSIRKVLKIIFKPLQILFQYS